MRGATESGEDADRFLELIGCGVTEGEVEVCGEAVGYTALGREKMRNGIAKAALAGEIGSGLKLFLGGGGFARVFGRSYRLSLLRLLAARGALRRGRRACANSD